MTSRALTATLSALSVVTMTAATGMTAAPHQAASAVLLEANIDEQPPIDFRRIASRRVVLSFVVGAAPVCPSSGGGPSFAFLIDADRNARSGAATKAFPGLGIDFQISVRCDASGQLVSTLGSATVRRVEGAPERWAIDVTTTVGALPSVQFLWVAISREGNRVQRLPAGDRVGQWSILELVIG
jgi:hypothetical protein